MLFASSFILPIIGFCVVILFCYLFSQKRNRIDWYSVGKCFLFAFALALIVTQISQIESIFEYLGRGVNAIQAATVSGTKFVFGYLGGAETPFDIPDNRKDFTHIFAFQSLPIVIVVSALSMLLFYWGIISFIIRKLSPFFEKMLSVGGAIGIASIGKVFFGPMEVALFVKPFIKSFSKCEVFTLMTLGLATSAMSVIPIYGQIIHHFIPNAMPIFLMTNVITIPIVIGLCKILEPDTHKTGGDLGSTYQFTGTIDAISRGTREGLAIFINILAMLIVMAALIALCNQTLGLIPSTKAITLQYLFGYVFSPVAVLMGVPLSEAFQVGELLGTKIALNEVFAFMDFAAVGQSFSLKTKIILTSSLASFANFGSIGVAVAGIAAMCPEQRNNLVALGFKSFLIGMLSTCMTAGLLGILLFR